MSGALMAQDITKPAGEFNRPVVMDQMKRLVVSNLDGDIYKLIVPYGAVGANKVYFDLFLASTELTRILQVSRVTPIAQGDTAITGALDVELYLTRTTAVGTGGTAATNEDTALNVATFVKIDTASPTIPTALTARLAPAGGATAGVILGHGTQFTEETNAATYSLKNLVDTGYSGNPVPIIVRPGSGLRVVQGSVASVSNIGFEVIFSIRIAG